MVKTAILYASGMTKNTKRLAEYIARKVDADTFNLKEMTLIDVSGYETIVFGTGIHAGKPYKQVLSYVQANKKALEGKDVKLFISCMYNDEKGKDQCAKVSKEFGIPDAVFFNKKEPQMNDDGFPASVDAFIARLRCRSSSSHSRSTRC